MKKTILLFLPLILSMGLVSHSAKAQLTEPALFGLPVSLDIELNDENYGLWKDHILPDSSELAWQEIPWLTTYKDGILAAEAADKPLLLWTMNGHPLGCT